MKLFQSIAALLCLGFLFVGFGVGSLTLSEASQKSSVNFRIRDEPETLDWNKAHTSVEAYVLMNLMEGLVSFDGTAHIIPSLAESWNVSRDGKIYTFTLRKGVKWSDGVPLKAQDFVYSWKRLLSPLTAASYAYLLFDIERAEDFHSGKLQDFESVGIKALGEFTVQVKLTQPVAHWLNIPAFWPTFPLRQDSVEKFGASWSAPGAMVTVGPYSLVAHDQDSKIVMRTNPHYYGQKGNVGEVNALIVKDDAAAIRLYETGKLDILTDISAGEARKWNGKRDLRTFPQLKTAFLAFVTEKYPVSQVRLRKAIAMAIDKVKLSQILHGGETPATSFIPPGMMGYSKKIGLQYNPVQAKREFQAAGLDTGSISIDYVFPNWDKNQWVAQFIRDELKKNLGLQVRLQSLDNKAYRAQLDLQTHPFFDYTWTADYPDPDSFLSLFLSTSGNSHTGWRDGSYDQIVQIARHSTDLKTRQDSYEKLQKTLLEDQAVIVPLYYEPNLALVSPRVKEFDLNPLDYLYLRRVSVIP